MNNNSIFEDTRLFQSLPDYKEFVDRQWCYLLEMMRTHRNSTNDWNKEASSMIIEASMSQIPNTERDPHEFRVDVVKKSVYDLTKDLAQYFYGVPMIENPNTTLNAIYSNKPVKLAVKPDLPFLALPEFGNIIVGEVKVPSTRSWIQQIQQCSYTIIINVDGTEPLEGPPRVTHFDRIIAFQILGKCKLGYTSDGRFHFFTSLLSVTETQIRVKVDITISKRLNRDTSIIPPAPFMLAKISEIQRTNPRVYREETEKNYNLLSEWSRETYFKCLTREFLDAF